MPYADPEKRRTYDRAYRLAHKDKISEEQKEKRRRAARRRYAKKRLDPAFREANHSRVKAWKTAYPERYKQALHDSHIKHRARRLQKQRSYAKATRARRTAKARKYYQLHQESIRQKVKAWVRLYPGKAHLQQVRRRARKARLPDTFTAKERSFMLAYWQHTCAACGTEATFDRSIVFDHWIPLASPGSPGTVAENMLPLCHGIQGCNNTKSARVPEEWLQDRFGAKKAKAILKKIHQYFLLVRKNAADGPNHRAI